VSTDNPASGDGLCRAEYVDWTGRRDRSIRLVRCQYLDGHFNEHEEAESGITWAGRSKSSSVPVDQCGHGAWRIAALIDDIDRRMSCMYCGHEKFEPWPSSLVAVPAETPHPECPNADDGIHCEHWYDGEPCCRCSAPEMPVEQRIEQGMEEAPAVRADPEVDEDAREDIPALIAEIERLRSLVPSHADGTAAPRLIVLPCTRCGYLIGDRDRIEEVDGEPGIHHLDCSHPSESALVGAMLMAARGELRGSMRGAVPDPVADVADLYERYYQLKEGLRG
jgi:hypothetical protein